MSYIARHLEAQFDRRFTAVAVRQTLHRARAKFSDQLLESVVHTLADPNVEELERELIELDLLELCRPALERWGQKQNPP